MEYTKEKSRVDVMQAVLFRQLREHYQQRDRLRLIVDYRRKFLDSLVRGGEEEAKQAETHSSRRRRKRTRITRRRRQRWRRRNNSPPRRRRS